MTTERPALMFTYTGGENARTPWNDLVSGNGNTLSYSDRTGGLSRELIAPYLVVALESAAPTAEPERLSIAEVDEVHVGRGARRAHVREARGGVAVLRVDVADDWMSSDHFRLVRSVGGWRLRDLGSKNGTFVGGTRRTDLRLTDGDLIEAGSTLLLFRDRARMPIEEAKDLTAGAPDAPDAALSTLSPALKGDFDALRRVAGSSVPLVLLGESGTGKEITARTVHELSDRSGDFIAVNCGALPATLVESELFGYRRGAFSGATEDRPGLVRASHRGTLMLDEIAELPEPAQAALLRVLQEREVVPVGDTRAYRVDLRIIAATHQDLETAVAEGRFRRDLYARLAGFQMTLPPLRERREDIGILVRALLPGVVGEARATEVKLDRAAARALFTYDWPLNVRELEQALSAAWALTSTREITLDHLPAPVRRDTVREADALSAEELELRAELEHALSTHRGNISAVARHLGKARNQVRRWCRRLSLDPKLYR